MGELEKVYTDNVQTIKYEYTQDEHRNLHKEFYANGDVVTYEYTESGDLFKQLRNGVEEVTYTYNEDGTLTGKRDVESGLQYTYGDTFEYVQHTDTNSQVYGSGINTDETTDTKSVVNEVHYGTQFVKATEDNEKENSVTYDYNTNSYSDTTYEQRIDTYHGRVYSESITNNWGTVLSSIYSYDKNNRALRKTYNELNLYCQVGYDSKDRITFMGYPWMQQRYFYDENDQLARVNSNSAEGYTSEYTYDDRGNILSKKKYAYTENTTVGMTPTETTTFEYKEAGSVDQLVKVNDDVLTYDANGNVLTYGDKVYTWERGRVLKTITEGENNYSYTYDDEGLRTSKTVDGVTTYYNYVDGQIVSQKTSGESTQMIFEYNIDGQPVGFTYKNAHYYYLTNQMGDIYGITDANGYPIAYYDYDEWGNLLGIVTATEGNAQQMQIATANPLRYRGYYYDNETGYYYLQSRYYDAEICRFLNADNVMRVDITERVFKHNIFIYCENNPVNNCDLTGEDTANFMDSSLVTLLSDALSWIMSGISSAIAGIKTAIATSWYIPLCVAAVLIAAVGITYVVKKGNLTNDFIHKSH